jgi:Uma2 family endonuclease
MMRDVHLRAIRRAEHIMAMPAVERRWTAREVRRLIAEAPLQTPRYELVNGELLVTPSPTGPHQPAVGLLLAALIGYFRRNPIGFAYTSPADVELEPGTIVQPDVFAVPVHEFRRLIQGGNAHELLVAAEVLSPNSGSIDKTKKRPLYQRHVPEYWIVDVDSRVFERWRPGDARPELIVQRLEWRPAGAPEPFVLDLPTYFAEVYGESKEAVS